MKVFTRTHTYIHTCSSAEALGSSLKHTDACAREWSGRSPPRTSKTITTLFWPPREGCVSVCVMCVRGVCVRGVWCVMRGCDVWWGVCDVWWGVWCVLWCVLWCVIWWCDDAICDDVMMWWYDMWWCDDVICDDVMLWDDVICDDVMMRYVMMWCCVMIWYVMMWWCDMWWQVIPAAM